jgi:hypothetical protein
VEMSKYVLPTASCRTALNGLQRLRGCSQPFLHPPLVRAPGACWDTSTRCPVKMLRCYLSTKGRREAVSGNAVRWLL